MIDEHHHSRPKIGPTQTRIIQRARELGFIEIGFTKPGRPCYFDVFRSWILEHKNAGMSWLERNMEIREDPSLLLPECRTIISLAYPYNFRKPCTLDGFTVARYSQPHREDYHQRVSVLCKKLVSFINDLCPGAKSRVCIDSAPLIERSFALSAGLGFIGKNTMLIIPGYGSYFYLAEILTTTSMASFPEEAISNQCGQCRQCIDSCPTGALEQPFVLNASTCLSYLTIECKGFIGAEVSGKMGDCFFGCDRCQEVCPFNRREDSRDMILPATDEFLKMDQNGFKEIYGKTAFARGGFKKLKSNILAIKGLKWTT